MGDLQRSLPSGCRQLEAVRDDTVQRLETRVSAAQSVVEEHAAQKVDSESAVLRQQVSLLENAVGRAYARACFAAVRLGWHAAFRPF